MLGTTMASPMELQNEVRRLSLSPEFNQVAASNEEIAAYGAPNTISFRDKHHFLDGVYNSSPDPEAISARRVDSIARQIGLSMEEVLLWLRDEKARRAKLEDRFRRAHPTTPPHPSPQSMMSPEPTTAGSRTVVAGSEASSTDFSQLRELLSCLSPTPTVTTNRSSTAPRRRGRPPKSEYASSTADMRAIPESKRQKRSFEHRCTDCNKTFAAERWAEHVKRVHFPDFVWECPKDGCHAALKPFYRPDNFATHLRGEHDCLPQEVSQLKETCKFEVIDFFHKCCGFCNEALKTREQSVDHIKEHFRKNSMTENPPADMGVSNWKHQCTTGHVLTRGVHYQIISVIDEAKDSMDDQNDSDDSDMGNSGSGPSAGKGNEDAPDPSSGGGHGSSDNSGFFSSHDFEFLDFDQFSDLKGCDLRSIALHTPPGLGRFSKSLQFLKSVGKRTEEAVEKTSAAEIPKIGSGSTSGRPNSSTQETKDSGKTPEVGTPGRGLKIDTGVSRARQNPQSTDKPDEEGSCNDSSPKNIEKKTSKPTSTTLVSPYPIPSYSEGLYPEWHSYLEDQFSVPYTSQDYSPLVDSGLLLTGFRENNAEMPYTRSPLFCQSPRPSGSMSQESSSYFSYKPSYLSPHTRRSGGSSYQTHGSSSVLSGDESRERGKCPHPDCGKVFKDLKAHMLTHQNERPERCPIRTCEYHTKGFARKYDKNRHTLTHYKGTQICGFCPGSGTPAEKSFNRADVFKRHLTSVHGVEQTPPNSRRRLTSSGTPAKSSKTYTSDAMGRCSTCLAIFTNAQDFYEHLDDCVLRAVQQQHVEYVNESHVATKVDDVDMQDTLRQDLASNDAPEYSTAASNELIKDDDDYEDGENDDEEDDGSKPSASSSVITRSKSGRLTHSKGGVKVASGTPRKARKTYSSLWGMSGEKMKLKKRVLTVFDGSLPTVWKKDGFLTDAALDGDVPIGIDERAMEVLGDDDDIILLGARE